jgi:hypothetical protein
MPLCRCAFTSLRLYAVGPLRLYVVAPLRRYAVVPLCRCAVAPSFIAHKFIKIRISSITFELKKQIYFFLFASDKKLSFGNFRS